MRIRISHQSSSRRKRNSFVLALLAAFVVLLSACGADDDSESAAPAPPPAPADAPAGAVRAEAVAFDDAAASAPPETAALNGSAGLGAPTALSPVDFGRDIVYTATITVEADDVAAASRQAVDIVQDLGGIVFAQRTLTEPEPLAEMTFKLRPGDFATALERLAGVGELVDQTVSAEDVTERIVDLESRIITAEASVVRLRGFLEQAAELEDVAQLERELLDRETVLETLKGQLRTLEGLVDLATITLTIYQSPDLLPDAAILVSASVTDNADDQCLGNHHIAIEPDATVYFCVEVENVGASVLTDVEVRPENLGIDVDSFRAVQGSFSRIEPGDVLVATLAEPVVEGRLAGRLAARVLDIGLTVEAVPVGVKSDVPQEVSGYASVSVEVVEEGSWPGFVDSVLSGAGAMRAIVSAGLIVFGVLVPFLPIIAAVIALIWWRRRRSRSTGSPPAPAN
ncbi:MAG: DUF4349 domain-containing protein [Acidimicrobiia bacterium]|nr:DUF4349 domain-containing protein [Acidimicrobiia bacterium]MYC44650.1 DUF4349 domain-containing protein [Acidimicrobiia bacterium]